jgi:peroxisomal 2,4-dienoyl-CoA reductase
MSDGIDWRAQRPVAGSGQALLSPFHGNILAGRTALVTGGGSGIGLEIARQLALHGARVAIMGRTESKLRAAQEALQSGGSGPVLTVAGDVRDAASAAAAVKRVAEQLGSLDILVNNAAGNFLCLAEDLSLGGFRSVVDIDLVGTFNMSRAALGQLKQSRGGGLIINITATLHYGATTYVTHASVRTRDILFTNSL